MSGKQGYYAGRVERNLHWVADGTYQSAFLTTKNGVVLLDAPPTIDRNLQRAVDEIANANGVSNKVVHHLLAAVLRPSENLPKPSLLSDTKVSLALRPTRRIVSEAQCNRSPSTT